MEEIGKTLPKALRQSKPVAKVGPQAESRSGYAGKHGTYNVNNPLFRQINFFRIG